MLQTMGGRSNKLGEQKGQDPKRDQGPILCHENFGPRHLTFTLTNLKFVCLSWCINRQQNNRANSSVFDF